MIRNIEIEMWRMRRNLERGILKMIRSTEKGERRGNIERDVDERKHNDYLI